MDLFSYSESYHTGPNNLGITNSLQFRAPLSSSLPNVLAPEQFFEIPHVPWTPVVSTRV
jgi:hypothetical protein